MNLAKGTFLIFGLGLKLISHQQHIALRQSIFRGGPGVLIFRQRTAKAILFNLADNLIRIRQIDLLHFRLETVIGIFGHSIGKLRECQSVIPGKEARCLQEFCFMGF